MLFGLPGEVDGFGLIEAVLQFWVRHPPGVGDLAAGSTAAVRVAHALAQPDVLDLLGRTDATDLSAENARIILIREGDN